MVTSRQVRLALRALRGTATPEEFADEAAVDRATVYRIEDFEKRPAYSPRVETISALVEARGLTLTEFFARIEGVQAEREPPITSLAQQEGPHSQGAAVSSAFREQLAVACLEAATDNKRRSLRGLLLDLAWAFSPRGQTPADRRDQAGDSAGDQRVPRPSTGRG